MGNGIGIEGHVTVTAWRNSQTVYHHTTRNRVVASGRNTIRNLLAGIGKPPRFIALGTGTTVVTDFDTGLAGEAIRRRVDYVKPSTDEVLYEIFLSESEGNGVLLPVSYTELGLFSGSAWETEEKEDTETRYPYGGGVLVARAKIAPCLKNEEVTMSVIWELRVESQT